MSSDKSEPSPLVPRLDQVNERIESALAEICVNPTVKKLNTGELIRVEETLAIAADAAKEAVSLRRRLRADRERAGEPERSG